MELTHRIEKVKLHGSGNAAFRLFSAMTGMTPLCLLFSAQFIGRYAEFIGRRFIGLPLMFIGRHPFITVSACRILQIGPILNYMSQPDKCSVRLRSEMKVKQQL